MFICELSVTIITFCEKIKMSVSKIVQKSVESEPFLLEGIARGIIHFGNLAAELHPKVESEAGKKVSESSIVMALRRYSESIQSRSIKRKKQKLYCQITMKTGICDFNVVKSPSLLQHLKTFYSMVNLDRGDFLSITIGIHEVSIAVSQKYYASMESQLKKEKILTTEKDLVALTIVFDGDFFNTPGVTYRVLQTLAWKNINIMEIISTMTELTLVIGKDDSIKSYEVLHGLIETF